MDSYGASCTPVIKEHVKDVTVGINLLSALVCQAPVALPPPVSYTDMAANVNSVLSLCVRVMLVVWNDLNIDGCKEVFEFRSSISERFSFALTCHHGHKLEIYIRRFCIGEIF